MAVSARPGGRESSSARTRTPQLTPRQRLQRIAQAPAGSPF